MSGRLNGIRVLVSGSSKGIGRGVAIRMAQEGAAVVINHHSDPGGADEAVAEIRAMGRRWWRSRATSAPSTACAR